MQIDFLQLSCPYGMIPYHAYLIYCFLDKKKLSWMTKLKGNMPDLARY